MRHSSLYAFASRGLGQIRPRGSTLAKPEQDVARPLISEPESVPLACQFWSRNGLAGIGTGSDTPARVEAVVGAEKAALSRPRIANRPAPAIDTVLQTSRRAWVRAAVVENVMLVPQRSRITPQETPRAETGP